MPLTLQKIFGRIDRYHQVSLPAHHSPRISRLTRHLSARLCTARSHSHHTAGRVTARPGSLGALTTQIAWAPDRMDHRPAPGQDGTRLPSLSPLRHSCVARPTRARSALTWPMALHQRPVTRDWAPARIENSSRALRFEEGSPVGAEAHHITQVSPQHASRTANDRTRTQANPTFALTRPTPTPREHKHARVHLDHAQLGSRSTSSKIRVCVHDAHTRS